MICVVCAPSTITRTKKHLPKFWVHPIRLRRWAECVKNMLLLAASRWLMAVLSPFSHVWLAKIHWEVKLLGSSTRKWWKKLLKNLPKFPALWKNSYLLCKYASAATTHWPRTRKLLTRVLSKRLFRMTKILAFSQCVSSVTLTIFWINQATSSTPAKASLTNLICQPHVRSMTK